MMRCRPGSPLELLKLEPTNVQNARHPQTREDATAGAAMKYEPVIKLAALKYTVEKKWLSLSHMNS